MLNSLKGTLEKVGLANAILFSGALISILWSVYFSIVTISMPYQIEFREGTAQVITKLLLNHSNPFSLENQPYAMTNYGLGYNLVVLPFAALFGNTLQVYRSITFIFILLAAVICFLAVYKTESDFFSSLACAAFVTIALIGHGGIGAFPSAMGTFLFLLAVLVPFFRSFDTFSLVLSSLFSLFAFYTKPYFALAFGIVVSYLFLFVTRKKGLVFSLIFLSMFAASFIIIRKFFLLYFIDTIIGNVSNVHPSFSYLYAQLEQLFFYFYPLLMLTLFILVFSILKRNKHKTSNQKGNNIVNLLGWDNPLIKHSMNYFLYFFICTFLAFILILGPHTGNYLNFAYQLMVPSFCCWLFQNYDPNPKVGILFALLVIFNLFIWESVQLNPQMLEQRNSKAWAEIYSYLKPTSNILNSSVVTAKLVEIGLDPVDSGQTRYFFDIRPYPDNKLIGPSYDTLKSNGLAYAKSIDDLLEKQNFDLVFTTSEKLPFLHMAILHQYYTQTKEIILDMPQTDEQWPIVIWMPINK